MFEMNQLTNEERSIMNRFSGRNMKAAVRNITRMLRRLTALRGWLLLGFTSQLHYYPV